MLRNNCSRAECYRVDLVGGEEESGIGLGERGIGWHIAAHDDNGIQDRKHGGQAIEVGGGGVNFAFHLGQLNVEGAHGSYDAV